MFGLSLWVLWSGCSKSEPEVAPAAPEPSDREQRSRKPRGDADGDGDAAPAVGPVKGAFTPAADPCAAPAEPGLYSYDTEFDGVPSHGLLYVPASAGPHDLVVVLHGGDASAEKILGQTRFIEQAEKDGFAILAPTAGEIGDHGRHWSSGKFDEKLADKGVTARDDVAFLDQLTSKARADVCAKRVLAAGFSSGGQMVHRWGCEGKQVDAVLSAAGVLLVDPAGCSPRAVRGYVGSEDKVFSGPPLEGSDQPSAVQTIERWAKINGCSDAEPVVEAQEDAQCRVWQGCSKATQLCVVEGFPHGWPSPYSKRKPTRCNATADGMKWFTAAVPDKAGDGGDGKGEKPEKPKKHGRD